MKFFFNTLIILLTLFASCGKRNDTKITAVLPSVSTVTVSYIGSSEAIVDGDVTSDGHAPVTVRGMVWSGGENPTVELSTKTVDGSGTGVFSGKLTNLVSSAGYYVRAYATNSVGTAYGKQIKIITAAVAVLSVPVLTTATVSSIGKDKAYSGGAITSDGNARVTEQGIVWSTSPSPTISLSTKSVDGAGFKTFTNVASGLAPYTKYYIRAYATNTAGTGYGDELSFTTLAELPTLTTTPVSLIEANKATSGGDITYNGGAPITARGIVWSTSPNPAITLLTKTSNGAGSGLFTSIADGLTASTKYYVQAWAINVAGVAYGKELSFTTKPAVLPTLTTAAVSSVEQNAATAGGNISSDGGAPVTARGVVWSQNSTPTVALSTRSSDGIGIGDFVSKIVGLSANTKYNVRAYATNNVGTAYGDMLNFDTGKPDFFLGKWKAVGVANPAVVVYYNITYSTAFQSRDSNFNPILYTYTSWSVANYLLNFGPGQFSYTLEILEFKGNNQFTAQRVYGGSQKPDPPLLFTRF